MKDDLKEKADAGVDLDNLFRQALSGQKVEPSPSLWKVISRRLMWRELLHLNFTNLSGKAVGVGVAAMAVLTAVTFFALHETAPTGKNTIHNSSPATCTPAPSGNGSSSHASASASASGSTSGSVSASESASGSGSASVSASTPAAGPATGRSSVRNLPSVHSAAVSPVDVIASNASGVLAPDIPSIPNTPELPVTRIEPYSALILMPSPTDDTLVIVTPTEVIKINRDNIGANGTFFSATIGVLPEAMFYKSSESYTKTNFWINGGITCNFSHFSIGITPGLGLVYDDGRYKVQYKSLDSIGFYDKVVSYSVNPVTNLIEYHTEQKSIYDSVFHVADDRTRNRYTYLQIPLTLGYRIFQTSTVSLSFNAGPAVSFLIGKKEADPVVDYRNARLIKVENETPVRVDVTWQAWAGFYFEYRLSKAASLYLQPVCKYYFNPTIEKEGIQSDKPWSVGLGVGLQFNFGQKRRQP
jgi:hypothetical protein